MFPKVGCASQEDVLKSLGITPSRHLAANSFEMLWSRPKSKGQLRQSGGCEADPAGELLKLPEIWVHFVNGSRGSFGGSDPSVDV